MKRERKSGPRSYRTTRAIDAQAIKRARKQLRWDQRELSEKAGVSVSSVRKAETDQPILVGNAQLIDTAIVRKLGQHIHPLFFGIRGEGISVSSEDYSAEDSLLSERPVPTEQRSQISASIVPEALSDGRLDCGAGVAVTHVPQSEVDADRFEVWAADRSWPQGSRPPNEDWDGTAIGDVLILGSALGKKGYREVDFRRVTRKDNNSCYAPEHQEKFQRQHEKLKHFWGKKASITRYTPPLTEDSTLYLEWETIDFSRARAFLNVVEADSEVWRQLSNQATELNPRPYPSILVTFNVVILAPRPHEKYLLLAHRTKGGRIGGCYNNRWSVSFEEQFFPAAATRDGRFFPADNPRDPCSTILRGVREEFLGEKFKGTCSVALHAIVMETLNLNIGLLGAVVLPGLEFSALAKRWTHPGAIDRKEHDALLCLPLVPELLERCINAEGLPHDLWEAYPKAGTELGAEDHLWHPTSKARLALTLWLMERGALEGW